MSLVKINSERNYNYFLDHEKYNENQVNKSASGVYDTAAIACDSAAGSQVGKRVLEQDGSVVDAAIASLLCNGLSNAQSMGIGGGFFMLHYSRKDEKITVIDARETAPAASASGMYRTNLNAKTKGGLSIGVPGEIKGYWLAHKMFGNLKWSKLFQPAIEMCNNGFQLPASQAKCLKYCETKIFDSQQLREIFVNRINNEIYKTNSIIKLPKLAKTLDTLAREGESAFYNGSLTDTIVNEIQSNGGIITKADLQSYTCKIREPVTYKLKNNFLLNSAPGPSCGLLLNFILAVLDGYNYDQFSLDTDEDSALFYHRFTEACKFAFGMRCLVGDNDFYDAKDFTNRLTDPEVVKEYRGRIDDYKVHPQSYYGSTNFVTDHGTAHTSIVGPNGDAVAVTSSINLFFGSKVMGDKTGIIYNNQMDDFSEDCSDCNSFSLPNYQINYVEPNKRPVSSMTPLIVLDDSKDVRLVCGSSGGTRIITSTALTAASNLYLKKDIAQSVNDFRLHHQLCPNDILYEDGFDPNVLERLSSCGHNLINFGHGGSTVQAIERLDDGRWQAVCDSRKGGSPSGY